MTYTVEIEKDGRVLIPEEVRAELHLGEGSIVRISAKDVELEAASLSFSDDVPEGALIEEDGLLVWSSPGPYTPGLDRQILHAIRKERDLRNLSPMAETLD